MSPVRMIRLVLAAAALWLAATARAQQPPPEEAVLLAPGPLPTLEGGHQPEAGPAPGPLVVIHGGVGSGPEYGDGARAAADSALGVLRAGRLGPRRRARRHGVAGGRPALQRRDRRQHPPRRPHHPDGRRGHDRRGPLRRGRGDRAGAEPGAGGARGDGLHAAPAPGRRGRHPLRPPHRLRRRRADEPRRPRPSTGPACGARPSCWAGATPPSSTGAATGTSPARCRPTRSTGAAAATPSARSRAAPTATSPPRSRPAAPRSPCAAASATCPSSAAASTPAPPARWPAPARASRSSAAPWRARSTSASRRARRRGRRSRRRSACSPSAGTSGIIAVDRAGWGVAANRPMAHGVAGE